MTRQEALDLASGDIIVDAANSAAFGAPRQGIILANHKSTFKAAWGPKGTILEWISHHNLPRLHQLQHEGPPPPNFIPNLNTPNLPRTCPTERSQ